MDMKAGIAIQILPQVSDKDELVRIVDEVIDYIKSTGLRYEVGPFETSLCEGRQRRGAVCPPAVKN